ncbi:MAG: tRNA pseudouridine(55) synthase TruB [Chloroflexota bacterium]|nr:MAG: tRNA pseudouridine(55) synthase TruB [Chloroflexota bacterium]
MDKEQLKDFVTGALVIDKPIGMTSHDVVKVVRHGTGIRRAGHTGTLDPRASGVLVVLIGPAVRLSEFLSASDKRYQAILRFGVATDTYDTEGKQVGETKSVDHISEDDFQNLLRKYEGKISQVPPAHSAVKVNGEKAYNLARRGEEVILEPRIIDVYNLELLEWAPPEAVIDVYASSGTYVRSLANDLGSDLGVGAHLTGLRRTKNGQFTLRDAVRLQDLKESFEIGDWYKHLIPAAETLSDWHTLELSPDDSDKIKNGVRIPAEPGSSGWARGLSEQGDLIALLEAAEGDDTWQPRKVFITS